MPLVERLSFHSDIKAEPPYRILDNGLVLPTDTHITYVGTCHDARLSDTEYLEEGINASHVVIVEDVGWDDAKVKLTQRIAQGDNRARDNMNWRMQTMIANDKSETQFNAEQAKWSMQFYKALFRSKVKVILPDYGIRHPALSVGGFAQSVREYSLSLNSQTSYGGQVDERLMRVKAKRDQYIARNICSGLSQLRHDDKFRRLPRLEVFMPYGLVHMAVPEVIEHAADSSGVPTLTLAKKYEDITYAPAISFAPEVLGYLRRIMRIGVVNYQNWLRTPEISTRA